MIAQDFLTHEAITRRLPVIDQFCSGLESLGFLDMIRQLPSVFEPLFIHTKADITPEGILDLIQFLDVMDSGEDFCAELVKRFVSDASKEGEVYIFTVDIN